MPKMSCTALLMIDLANDRRPIEPKCSMLSTRRFSQLPLMPTSISAVALPSMPRMLAAIEEMPSALLGILPADIRIPRVEPRGFEPPTPPPCKGAKGFSGASWCVRVRGLDKPKLDDRRGLNSGCVRFCPGGVAARLLHQQPPQETRSVYAPGCTLQRCHILCIKGNLIQRSARLFDTRTCCAEGLCARGSGKDVGQATDRLYARSRIWTSQNFPSETVWKFQIASIPAPS
jgi:hypothetical protein